MHKPKRRGGYGTRSYRKMEPVTGSIFLINRQLLIVLLLRLEIGLRMVTSRTEAWRIFCFAGIATVAALPPQLVFAVEEVAVGDTRE